MSEKNEWHREQEWTQLDDGHPITYEVFSRRRPEPEAEVATDDDDKGDD